MPSTSKKQAKYMAAAAHNPEFAEKAGISQKVAKEFNNADKGKKKFSESEELRNIMESIEVIFGKSEENYIVPNVTTKEHPRAVVPSEPDGEIRQSKPKSKKVNQSKYTRKITNQVVKQGPWGPADDPQGVTTQGM